MFIFRPSLVMCGYSGQQCCVEDVYSIFYFLIEGSHLSKGSGRKHTHTTE